MKSNRPQFSRKGMTLLEMTVVILVLLSLIAIFFVGARGWKRGSDRAGCIINIRKVQVAVRSYQNLYNIPAGAVLDFEIDIMGVDSFVREAACPGGGKYTRSTQVPDVGELALNCSLADEAHHEPNHYTSW